MRDLTVRHLSVGIPDVRSAVLAGVLRVSVGSIARPRSALVIALVVTLLCGLGIFKLGVDVDGRSLAPPEHEVIRRDARLRSEFGLGDPVVVFLDTRRAQGIFEPTVLDFIHRLSTAFAAIPDLQSRSVVSLATEASSRVYPGTLNFRPLLDPIPRTPAEMARLRDEVDGILLFDDVLLTKDRAATAILVRMPVVNRTAQATPFTRRAILTEIRERVRASVESTQFEEHAESTAGMPAVQVRIVGAPVAELELGAAIITDLVHLIPLCLTLIALTTWIAFRRPAAVALVLLKVPACLLFTFGLMGWMDISVQLPSAVIPVVLMSTSISDEVFILNRYQLIARCLCVDGVDFRDSALAARTMTEMIAPATITSAMMIVGFLSFASSPIGPVFEFGILTATGLLFAWAWSISVTPALLRLLGKRLLSRPSDGLEGIRHTEKVIERLSRVGPKNPRLVFACSIGILALLAAGIDRVYVQDSWLDAFAANSDMRRDTVYVDSVLGGTHTLLLYVQWPHVGGRWPQVGTRQGPILAPDNLKAIDHFEDELRKSDLVGVVVGPATQLKYANYLFNARRPGTRQIPSDAGSVSQVIDSFDTAQGVRRRREVFADDMHRGVITVLVKRANFQTTAKIMEKVRQLESNWLTPIGARVDFGGDLATSQTMIPSIVSTQLYSMVGSLAGVFIVLVLFTGSFYVGVLALLPSCAAVLGLFGIMGYSGVPVGVATSMICAMLVGLGSDYAVYYLDRARRFPDRDRHINWWNGRWRISAGASAAVEAANSTSRAVLTVGLAVAGGFALLGVSSIPVNARLGLFVSLTLIICVLLTLFAIPAAVALHSRIAAKRDVFEPLSLSSR
jgi:predicted RND superfamily exporter protein